MSRAKASTTLGWILGLVSCASPAVGPQPDKRELVVDIPTVATAAPSLSTTPIATDAPSATAEPPKLGRDHRTAVPCSVDDDCGWDDPCLPSRCVEASPPAVCEESAPAPGSCLCVAGACTLKPSKPPIADGPCETRGCVVDRAGGTCVAETAGVAEGLRTNPGLSSGPSCDCDTPGDGCTFRWFEPVACKSERDCWVDSAPRPHPVKRPKSLRGRDFKPCSDGEIAPSCNDGVCRLGLAYRC